jgi:hypothetical protein
MPWLLLAQGDPISAFGAAGWSSFGIAGLVLGWLLIIHLPAKDKQVKELNESKDKSLEKKDDTCASLIREKDQQTIALQKEKDQQIAAKDQQIAAQRAEMMKALSEQRVDCLAALGKTTDQFAATTIANVRDYREALQQSLKHCEEEVATMATGMRDSVESMAASVKETFSKIMETHGRSPGAGS